LDFDFADKFGFTEDETKQILSDFKLSHNYKKIKEWYNGYHIGDIDNIYNPWSILNYVTRHREGFKTFWANTSSDGLIKKQLKENDANEIRKELSKLIKNETIEKDIEENFVFPDLENDKELIWTLLVYSGYLTQTGKVKDDRYKIKIPNYEIKKVFEKIVIKWLSTDIKIRKSLLENTANYLVNNEIAKFETGFKEIMGDTFSYFDKDIKSAENIYFSENTFHSYLLGLLAILGDDYIIKSNRESGEGRYDIMLIPFDKTKFGVVIEIKQIKKQQKTETKDEFLRRINLKIEEASNQIDRNKYYKELIDNKIASEKIVKLPIVFAGKEPYVKQK